MKMPKNYIVTISILATLLVISVIYILHWEYMRFQESIIKWAYNKWMEDAIITIMEKAKDPSCEPVNLFKWEETVDLINISCLQQNPSKPQLPE